MKINLNEIRREYTQGGLSEHDTSADPIALFEQWLTSIYFPFVCLARIRKAGGRRRGWRLKQ